LPWAWFILARNNYLPGTDKAYQYPNNGQTYQQFDLNGVAVPGRMIGYPGHIDHGTYRLGVKGVAGEWNDDPGTGNYWWWLAFNGHPIWQQCPSFLEGGATYPDPVDVARAWGSAFSLNDLHFGTVLSRVPSTTGTYTGLRAQYPKQLTKMKRSAEMIAASESLFARYQNMGTNPYPNIPRTVGQTVVGYSPNAARPKGTYGIRHNGLGLNLAFADGHIEWRPYDKLRHDFTPPTKGMWTQ
jgi:prepilin-type processing-associated H-X9-DG protein